VKLERHANGHPVRHPVLDPPIATSPFQIRVKKTPATAVTIEIQKKVCSR
jgi:hypothetical protein